ncbi:MAG: hypothetical protein M1434_00095 [Chloroflexi bacterium]|nr:hypothetical protein [Chloroflexota bacterium]
MSSEHSQPNPTMNHIGTLRESSLHAALKDWYARPGDRFEVEVDRSIIDIVRGGTLIEIQTRNFMGIKRKLHHLTENHIVRLVYPIAREKWIVRLDSDNETQVSRRKSPKRGRIEQLFMELVNVAPLLKHPSLSLEVLFIREDEVWSKSAGNQRRSWRRGGWARYDRRLIDVVEQRVFHTPTDFLDLLPNTLPSLFTNHELAHALGQPSYLAERMSYCLRHMGMLEVAGKHGRSLLFQRKETGR